jgi:hypothetical protein
MKAVGYQEMSHDLTHANPVLDGLERNVEVMHGSE